MAVYTIGQKVCLWDVEHKPGSNVLQVLKEVIVTITEIKTGAPGEFSRTPTALQSLRGLGDDGKIYEKHWESWPESQTNDFMSQWSMRDDAERPFPMWIPQEAVYVWDSVIRPRHGKPSEFALVDANGRSSNIIPKGDVSYCDKHGLYSHQGARCLLCIIAERRAA